MNRHNLIVVLFVIALLCVDALLTGHVLRGRLDWPSHISVLLVGLLLGQLAWLSVWTVFGRANIALRVTTLIVAQILVVAVASKAAHGSANSWAVALICFVVIVLMASTAAAAWGVRLGTSEIKSARKFGRSTSEPYQFSLLQLISLTTAIAVSVGYLSRNTLQWSIAPTALLFFGFLGLIAITSLFSTLNGSLLRAGCLLAILFLICCIWFAWIGVEPSHRFSLIQLAVIVQGFLLASGIIFRIAGYQFFRRSSFFSRRRVSTPA